MHQVLVSLTSSTQICCHSFNELLHYVKLSSGFSVNCSTHQSEGLLSMIGSVQMHLCQHMMLSLVKSVLDKHHVPTGTGSPESFRATGSLITLLRCYLTLLHTEWPKLSEVLAILSALGSTLLPYTHRVSLGLKFGIKYLGKYSFQIICVIPGLIFIS